MPKPAVSLVLGALLLVAGACASVETGPPRDVAGTWTGQCVNCPVKGFRLVLKQDGDKLTGTLQASGQTGLGENEMPLWNGKIAGRTVSFETVGRDRVPFVADLRVSGDGKSMTGTGRHRAAFGLGFTRTGP
jgi:hypothetical protein